MLPPSVIIHNILKQDTFDIAQVLSFNNIDIKYFEMRSHLEEFCLNPIELKSHHRKYCSTMHVNFPNLFGKPTSFNNINKVPNVVLLFADNQQGK